MTETKLKSVTIECVFPELKPEAVFHPFAVRPLDVDLLSFLLVGPAVARLPVPALRVRARELFH
jgi:hypothetical protein